MKIGFLFPGQGAQSIGMGKDFYDEYDEAKLIYNKVKEITGIDIGAISFDGPEDTLNRTKYTQLAIFTHSLAILEILKNNKIEAEVSAGLSLGEYSALVYSKAISIEDGIRIVQKRGEYMEKFLPKGNWKMAAVLGLEDKQVEEICKKVLNGFVVPVNYNCKGQVVISGEEEAIIEAEGMLKEAGAKKIKILKTAGPFHTEKLLNSAKALRKELDKIEINSFETKVINNLNGEEYNSNDNVREILEKHIISPVKFSKTLEKMMQDGVDTFIEIGPGKTLSGFVKRTPCNKEINIFTINDVKSLKETINCLNN